MVNIDTPNGSVLASMVDDAVPTENPTLPDGSATMTIVKPDGSNLDPIAKPLCIDLWSENEKDVETAMLKLADLFSELNNDEY